MHIRGVHLVGVHLMGVHLMGASHGRVSFAGMHLKGLHLSCGLYDGAGEVSTEDDNEWVGAYESTSCAYTNLLISGLCIPGSGP
jgi:hypothetical protein